MGYSVITISRQYGSGGREVGLRLARRLGVPFYDRALCTEAARRSGFDSGFLERAEQMEGRKLSYLFQANSVPFCLPVVAAVRPAYILFVPDGTIGSERDRRDAR